MGNQHARSAQQALVDARILCAGLKQPSPAESPQTAPDGQVLAEGTFPPGCPCSWAWSSAGWRLKARSGACEDHGQAEVK
jgi:hypothetical protein